MLQILFPRRCLSCRVHDDFGLCDDCVEKVPFHKNIKHDHVISIFPYKNPVVKHSLWECKFNGNFDPLSRLMPLVYDVILDELGEKNLFNNFQNPVLVPIPLHKNRHRLRGFNQSEIIAYELYAKNPTIFDFNEKGFVRFKETKPQAKIAAREQRIQNVKDCFLVTDPELFHNKNIILIDDITTTGATLEEARKVLKKAGARNVYAVTIAQ